MSKAQLCSRARKCEYKRVGIDERDGIGVRARDVVLKRVFANARDGASAKVVKSVVKHGGMIASVVGSVKSHADKRHSVAFCRADKRSARSLGKAGLDSDRTVVTRKHFIVVDEKPPVCLVI